MKLLTSSVLFEATVCLRKMRGKKLTFTGSNCPRGGVSISISILFLEFCY